MRAEIGIIGGSGLYEFTKSSLIGEFFVATPYGAPTDKITLFKYANKTIAFLPRHGKHHQFPPHRINYRANIFALKRLGVQRIIAPTAVGSLKSEIKPGDFIIPDQFINNTHRADTFFNGPANCPSKLANSFFSKTAHISMAQPYCEELRKIAISQCDKLGISYHHKGTVMIIEGPRFSTMAESQHFAQFSDVINMTQYPEVALARELGMCYLNISLATDYDAGLKGRGDIKPVTSSEVVEIFKQNNKKVKSLILKIIEQIPINPQCACKDSLKNAFIN